MITIKSNRFLFTLFYILSTALLFLGFYRNQWNAVRPGKFNKFQQDSESLVLGRMVETRQSGLFSHGALMGRGNVLVTEAVEERYTKQYDAYFEKSGFSTYNLYQSQSGGQAFLFGALDLLSPFTPHENLRVFRVMAALLLALTLSVFLLWVLKEFGLLAAFLVLTTTMVSPWLTFFGRNLFYLAGFLYIPLVASIIYHEYKTDEAGNSYMKIGILTFVTVELKCLFNGFDFIVPTIAMPFIPLIYFAWRDRSRLDRFIKKGMAISVGIALAIVAALSILAFQIASATGEFSGALTYLADTFERRSVGDPEKFPEYAASLDANVWDVVDIYLQGDQTLGQLKIRFLDLIIVFFVATSAYLIVARRVAFKDSNKAHALIISTWTSILSPLSWFALFKGQAYMHAHTNFLAWYMPFILFGFALCGYVLQSFMLSLSANRKSLFQDG